MSEKIESIGVKGGIWQALLFRKQVPARICLTHQGEVVAPARVSPEEEGVWRIAVSIPAERISDGMQTFVLIGDSAAEGEPVASGAEHLGAFSMLAGTALDYDLQAEIDLLKAEMELLKREFRRMAARLPAPGQDQ